MNVFRPRVNKKLSTILFIFITVSNIINAQLIDPSKVEKQKTTELQPQKRLLSNEEFFNNSDYILEVKLTNKDGISYDAKGEHNPDDIYRNHYCTVSYIYKGNSDIVHINDTIIIARKGGTFFYPVEEELGMYMEEIRWWKNGVGIQLERNIPTIVFLQKSDFPGNPDKNVVDGKIRYFQDVNNNFVILKFLQDEKGALLNISGKITGLNGLSFNNREELFEYMQQFEDVSGQNYYDENDKYWKQKYVELEEFKENFPKFDLQSKLENGKLPKEAYFEYRNVAIKYL
ncbi:MAG: hypothetical protein LBV69_00310, partial [Bacteroidales bacterium]|nr:hypothetical protein [Bacteroidales bacterium]